MPTALSWTLESFYCFTPNGYQVDQVVETNPDLPADD
jgi:hypothetical protein